MDQFGQKQVILNCKKLGPAQAGTNRSFSYLAGGEILLQAQPKNGTQALILEHGIRVGI
jgi:hypothetical protein